MESQDSQPLLEASAIEVEKPTTSRDKDLPFSGQVYAIIAFLGFGMLAPWNILLNSIPYFQDEYAAQKNGVAFYMTAAYIYPQLPLLGVMVMYGSRVAFRWRIVIPLLLQLGGLVILPIIASSSIWAMLVIVFVVGLCTAVFQSSGFAFASLFPPVYAQAIMFGQGIAGVVSGVAELLVMAFVKDTRTAAIAYFVFAAACLALCAASYIYLERSPFTQHYLARSGLSTGKALASTGDESTESTRHSLNGDMEADRASTNSDDVDAYARGGPAAVAAARAEREASQSLLGNGSSSDTSTWAIMRGIWPMAASVFSVFFMTFLVFPGVAPASVDFKGTFGSLQIGNDWWNAILLLVFNVADTIGRGLPAKVQLLKGYPLLFATFFRYGIVPLFLGCARSWSPFFGDATVLVVMAIFAITNGYFSSMSMMLGPSLVPPHQRQQAGLLMTFFLQLGLLLGSQAAFAFTGGPAT